MSKKIFHLLNAPFPYYLNDQKKNTFMVIGVCVFLAVFMITFHPGHIRELRKIILTTLTTLFILVPGVIVTPRILPKFFDHVSWTFGKHLIYTSLLVASIGIVLAGAFQRQDFYPNSTYTEILVHIAPSLVTYGIIPITLVTLVMRNVYLRQNLEQAAMANKELDKMQRLTITNIEEADVATILSDTRETLTLNIRDLLFIEACDNYCTIHWKVPEGIRKRILRTSLKAIESQFHNSYTIRCHRSFIVNIYAIELIFGNSNGYKLSIVGDYFTIPVSRTKGKMVVEKIKNIRNSIELSNLSSQR